MFSTRARVGGASVVYFDSALPLKKSSAQKIFGSNLFLKNGRIEFKPISPYAELRSARENFPKKELCLVMVLSARIELALKD